MAVPQVSAKLTELYEGYYAAAGAVDRKRHLAALDSLDHIEASMGSSLGRLVDVGAGNGALLAEIAKRGWASDLTAVEISTAGIEAIRTRDIPGLSSVEKFDGYQIPCPDKAFDTAICVHVMEHVEHERLFLGELKRIARRLFIEVPLEGGLRGRILRDFGHINYYTPALFLNLLETSGLRPTRRQVFTSSRDYEVHCYGRVAGTARSVIRRSLLAVAGERVAPHLMTYLLAVVCET